MTSEDLFASVLEAERFLVKAKRLKYEHAEYVKSVKYAASIIESSKTSAAVRRSSMDLTRALADLRRSS